MVCPYCHSPTLVTNSRPQKRTNSVWRRRQCRRCKVTITSVESADFTSTLLYRGKTAERPFSEDTLFVSLYECCKHRADAVSSARYLTRNTLAKLQKQLKTPLVERSHLINCATATLRNYDQAAAVQYSAYHPL